MRKALTTAAALVATLGLAVGCDSGRPSEHAVPVTSVPATSPAVTTPEPSVSASPAPPPPVRKLKSGAKGVAVLALQQRLAALGYWNGAADGKFGGTTEQAVYAVQKAAHLARDGVVGPKTQRALDRGVRPTARSKAGSGRLIEINLAEQLLLVVDDGKVTATLNTSTGSNKNYVYDGGTYLADTPPGHFTAGREIDGWRHGPLGPLWRPKYFNGGIAVHGAPSVPAYPASHGCARVSISAMNWIWSTGKMPLKTKVWVYAS